VGGPGSIPNPIAHCMNKDALCNSGNTIEQPFLSTDNLRQTSAEIWEIIIFHRVKQQMRFDPVSRTAQRNAKIVEYLPEEPPLLAFTLYWSILCNYGVIAGHCFAQSVWSDRWNMYILTILVFI